MFLGIRVKLIATTIVLVAVGMGLYLFLTYKVGEKVLLNHLQDDSYAVSRLLSSSFAKIEEIKAKVNLKDLVKVLSLTEGVFEIDIYDESGKIIFSTFPKRAGTMTICAEVHEVIDKGYFLSGFKSYKDEVGLKFEEKVFKGFYPLFYKDRVVGAVGVALEIYDYLAAPAETKNFIVKEMEKTTRLLGETVAYAASNTMDIEGFVNIEDLILTLTKDSKAFSEINIVNKENKVVLSNKKDNFGKIMEFDKSHFFRPRPPKFVKKQDKRFYEVCIPIKFSQSIHLLNILYDTSDAYNQLSLNLRYNILIAMACLLLSILFISLLSNRITKPIDQLVVATEVIAAGNLDHSIAVKSSDEIGRLATSFNTMIEGIKEVQARMVQSAKLAAIGQLAAGIAHELRNPLAVIKNSVYFINSRLNTADEKVNKHLAMINIEIDASEKIISDLLSFSRTPKGEFIPTQVNDVLARIFSFLAPPPNIVLKKELAPDLPLITGDADQLRQVFLNLIINAFEAMPKGGELKIATEKEGDNVSVSFTDSGLGISEENLRKLWDPFFTTKIKGTGLGLAICLGIVQRHYGTIAVESKLKKGSKFTVILPVRKAA